MQRSVLIVLFSIFSILTAPLAAQLSDVSGNPGFSGQSAKFSFTGLSENSDVSNVLGEWGITFQRGEWGTPTAVATFAAGSVNIKVLNRPSSGTSANRPMVLNFRDPLSKVGMILSGGTAQTQAQIEAYGPLGTSLGSVQISGLAEARDVAVSTTSATGISKLVISYGSDAAPEELDDLQVQYIERPQFVSYLPQVGNGAIGSDSLQTTIVVSNLSNSTAKGEVEFFNSGGTPLELQIAESAASSFPLTVPPFSSLSGTTGGVALAIGYARITSNVPIEGTAVFRIVTESGAVKTEAGVGGAKGAVMGVGAVQKAVAGSFDSGIAVVNTSGRAASARVDLLDQRGVVVDTNADVLVLGPGEQTAKFLSEIFPDIKDSDFDGTIRFESDVPLSVAILRTGNGLVLSSLPVGTTQK
jgi:hypothetical protein